jgi:peptidyl-prolyl cis-trans isomerase-like protein 2
MLMLHYVRAEGMYCCPVTGKVFTEHTHIAAVKTTGNVYAYEAVSWLAGPPV